MTAGRPRTKCAWPSARYTLFPTPLGTGGIAWASDLVVATHLPERSEAATGTRLSARTSGAEFGEPTAVICAAIESITALLRGERHDLSQIACDFSRVDPFADRVYTAARTIAPGETRTYGAIAEELGDKRLAQSVGRALGRNPFPIIVPCHRVLGTNGRLTGFSANGGVETKLRMLSIENAQIGGAAELFDALPVAAKLKTSLGNRPLASRRGGR